ncbi:DnaB-like helicase N-terminal domain-containing protein [Streptomyces sp. NPDC127114]|uniref:DnaB-like helicase N-terminal domain-containing protein n=1 Tax=Streptomyces sp. NPDC127114 TaxID=3345366 RepID=UPI00362F04D3
MTTAQRRRCSALLLSTDTVADVVEILQAHDFYEPAHALIYDAVLRVYGAGESPDPVRVPRCSTPPARRPRPEAWTISAH